MTFTTYSETAQVVYWVSCFDSVSENSVKSSFPFQQTTLRFRLFIDLLFSIKKIRFAYISAVAGNLVSNSIGSLLKNAIVGYSIRDWIGFELILVNTLTL